MSVRAGKYNTKLHKYEDVLLPDECRTYEEDMEKMVPCAQCGRLHKYGEMYTSREVHTAYGFGFAVCREWNDNRYIDDPGEPEEEKEDESNEDE